MNSASTREREDFIRRGLKSPHFRGEMILYVEKEIFTDEEGNKYLGWFPITDIDEGSGITISKSVEKYAYAQYPLTPAASSISFSVLNERGQYGYDAPGSDAGVFDINTRIKASGGYVCHDSVPRTIALFLGNEQYSSYRAFTHRMSFDGSRWVDDGAAPQYTAFKNKFNVRYDSTTYDSTTYTPDAYVIFEYDFIKSKYADITGMTILSNNTKGQIFYRAVNASGDSSDVWTSGGNTINGSKGISVNLKGRYLQIAILYDGISYDGSNQINGIQISYKDYLEIIYNDIFLLDAPNFSEPPVPEIPRVVCSGRDAFRRALEIALNIRDVSAGVAIDVLIKEICDAIGIKYNLTSIAPLSSFGNRELFIALEKTKKAAEIFEYLMQIIQKGNDRYIMYLQYSAADNDNILFVQPVPTDIKADYVFSYQHYESLGDTKRNYDKLLNRLSIQNEEKTIAQEVTLNTAIITTSPQTVTWSGQGVFKRLIKASGNNNLRITAVTDTSMTFACDDTTINTSIRIYGQRFGGTAGEVFKTGTGQDGFSVRGNYILGNTQELIITIASGTSFRVKIGSAPASPPISITGDWQDIRTGQDVKFSQTSGYSVGDTFRFMCSVDNPKSFGEFIDYNNMVMNRGQGVTLTNPIVLNTDEARIISEKLLLRYANPTQEARALLFPYNNFLMSINDMVLLWSRATFIDRLYYIVGVEHRYSNTGGSSSFSLQDSGLRFDNIIYDRADNELDYDEGFIYDMSYGANAKISDTDISKYNTDQDAD